MLKRINIWVVIFLAAVLVALSIVIAQVRSAEASLSEVKAKVIGSVPLITAEMRNMPRKSISLTGKKGETLLYEGVSLTVLLDSAGLSSRKLKPKELVKCYLVAKGADGFNAVFSLAEIDTAFGGMEIIIADRVNGQLLSAERGPYQLVAMGDKRPTRNCYQLEQLTVYEAKIETE